MVAAARKAAIPIRAPVEARDMSSRTATLQNCFASALAACSSVRGSGT